jgi:hypothetical protein
LHVGCVVGCAGEVEADVRQEGLGGFEGFGEAELGYLWCVSGGIGRLTGGGGRDDERVFSRRSREGSFGLESTVQLG